MTVFRDKQFSVSHIYEVLAVRWIEKEKQLFND